MSPPVVYKFGGVALADGAAIRHAASIVAALPHRQVVVTVSAMAAVTNTLFDVALHAAAGDLDTGIACLDALRYRHVETWTAACDEPMPPAILTLFAAVEQTVRDVAAERTLPPRIIEIDATLTALIRELDRTSIPLRPPD